MAKIRTHYDELEATRNAPDFVIKAAYKALCQTYHPDKFQGSKEEANRLMKLINLAYAELIDPIKRANYDRWIDEQEAKAKQQSEKPEFHDFDEPTEQQHQQRQDKHDNPETEEPPQSTNSNPNNAPPNTNTESRSTPINSGWLRFFARMFDVWWEALIVTTTIVYLFRLFQPGFDEWLNNKPTSVTQVGFFCFPIAFVLDAMLYSVFGNTPGKAWIGIKVKNAAGLPLDFSQYLGRNFKLYVSGFALGLPIIGLFPMVNQSIRLRRGQQASYDESTGFRVYEQPVGWIQKTSFGLAFASLFVVMSVLNSMGKKHQKRRPRLFALLSMYPRQLTSNSANAS